MEKIGIDVHKVATQVCVLTETGEYEERRIRTERSSLTEFFGKRPKARVLLEAARGDLPWILEQCAKVDVHSLEEALRNIATGGFSVFLSHRSTEASSEFLPYLPLMYGARSPRVWFKAGAPNGERNLQHYNPLLRAEDQLRARGYTTKIAAYEGLPAGVIIPSSPGRDPR